MINAQETDPSAIRHPPSVAAGRFTLGFYFQALTRMLSSPGRFFAELPQDIRLVQPLGFLVSSSLFFAGAGMTTLHESRLIMGGIWGLNAVVMPVILAGISFIIMTMSMGKRVTFERMFAIYAFASGVTLLASWIPLFVWITEPWKWVLIVLGMVKGCGFKWRQAILIAAGAIFVLLLLFWSAGPLIYFLKN